MSFGQNKPVTILGRSIFLCHIHDFKKQLGNDVGCTQCAPRMTAFGIGYLADNVLSNILRVKL